MPRHDASVLGKIFSTGLVVASLAACAPTPEMEARDTNAIQPDPAPSYAGSRVLGALGTPFYIAFKIPICALTLALAGPAAGASELSGDFADGEYLRHDLEDGITDNCGPPYAITP